MYNYQKVWRFLQEEIDESILYEKADEEQKDFYLKNNLNREDFSDSSPLEYDFEEKFTDVYGPQSIKFLNKEYSLSDYEGNTYFLDYLIQKDSELLAVEENGIQYHHPQIIGQKRYAKQLKKQNTCTAWRIKLFRFSTEDCKIENRIQDSIRTYFGSDSSHFKEKGLLANRKITLYEHQKLTLEEIKKERQKGTKSFLVVFPTASGKSKIIEEDIKIFANQTKNFSALILTPNTNIISDWKERIQKNLYELKSKITVCTFNAISRNYSSYRPENFSYIVVDEAHHAVAPVLKRVIQYFTPDFLIGLTATDQRPDKKKLEDIFGSYRTSLSLEEAMNKKIIAKANVFRIETNIDLSKIRINGKDYVNADLEKSIRVTSRNDLIADVIEKYFSDGKLKDVQGVIFCVNTEHTKEIAKILQNRNITANAYSRRERNCDKIMQDFKEKKIRFLCSCNMISEGWDYPELKILIMARPTLSKVLYLQQIGRGLRKTATKENVFIIDVVDQYGPLAMPCSMHSIFQNQFYVPFGDITKRSYKIGDFITIDGLSEHIEKITEVNISDFSQKYDGYFSAEQVAQDFFISTETITNWIKTKKILPTVTFSFGSKKIALFSPEDVEKIRAQMKIQKHDESTIYKDFFDFLEQRDYTFSYKMPFLLSFLKNVNQIGEAKIDNILNDFTNFYKNRLFQNLTIERKNCPFTKEYLNDNSKMKQNMLSNPFEKFERKRFMYYSKDLNIISMNPFLFEKLDEPSNNKIKKQMTEDLENYFKNIGGVYKNDSLVLFAQKMEETSYIIEELPPLMVAESGAKEW